MKRAGYLLFLLLAGFVANAQNIDSLELLARTATDIDKRADAIKFLGLYYLHSDTVKSKAWCAEGMRLAKEHNNVRALILANENYGRYYTEQGRYDSAIVYLQSSFQYDTPENNSVIASSYISLGNIYDIQSNYEKALECYLAAEKRYEPDNNQYGLGLAQMGIGNIYNTTGFYEDAKNYFRRSYKNLLVQNELYASWSMNNLATSMTALGEYDSAVFFFEKSLEIKLRHNDVYGASYTYNDLGSLYFDQGKYDKALSYYLKALESKEGLEGISKETLSNTFLDIAKIYVHQKNYLSAIFYGEQGLENAIASSSVQYQSEAYRLLADANYKTGNFKSSYELLDAFISVKDSLDKMLYNDKLADMRSKYDADQKQKEIELLNASNQVSQLEAEQARQQSQTLIFYLIGAGLIIVLVAFLGVSLYRSNQVKNKTNELLVKKNDEINHQKELVEEKNKEITDSINYAKRIQNAILPPKRLIEKSLPDAFILYKPKDIVAGDFYWLETIRVAEPVEATDGTELILFAVADCTGHGVPGALVSVVCHNALNRSVREYGITDPGKILDKTREIVIREFEKSDDEVKDGMDISLCALSVSTRTLHWSGANNPLWVFRKNSGELEELKADKQPVGKFAGAVPFTTYTIQLAAGDSIYLFSDGYQDQFGGEKGKKFKASNLKQLLLTVRDKSMAEQCTVVEKEFASWRGALEQVDDVCVMGVRL